MAEKGKEYFSGQLVAQISDLPRKPEACATFPADAFLFRVVLHGCIVDVCRTVTYHV